MNNMQAAQFEMVLEEQRKALERLAIQALILAKMTKIRAMKQTSSETLNELAEAMFHQTAQVLPSSLEGALQGKTAKAAKKYLESMKRPQLKTPVREGRR